MLDVTNEKVPDWKELEYLVAIIQKQLSPDASVQNNVMLDGLDSETKRQIDVLVEPDFLQNDTGKLMAWNSEYVKNAALFTLAILDSQIWVIVSIDVLLIIIGFYI